MGENSNLLLDTQRRLARSILIGLVTSIVLFVLFASGPSLGLSFAQQPTPTYKVSFLNPSGHSEEISAKDDRSNTTYHLVAWVNELPADAGVVFAYQSGNTEVEIGTGTQTGITDTFALNWDIPSSVADGPFTLHAILYSGQTEVARDTESDLVMNNKDPGPTSTDPEPRGETVEFTYPAVGGAFGFYTPRDLGAAGVTEVSFSTSADHPRTTFVRVFFTTTSPGNEPAWTTCGTESASAAANGVRCTLPTGTSSSSVTALAAMANDTPQGGLQSALNDSGDAHRIAPYTQNPTNFTVDPSTQSVTTAGNCSAAITAQLTDQNSIAIAAANIDVHAAGPSDQLFFEDAAQAPEQAHSKEPARDCATQPNPPSAGQQGEHENTAGNDVKHAESPSGTDDDGKWVFQLFSPTAGSTQYTAWVDHDADDFYCSSELNASGAVGWQEGAPGIAGVSPETSNCPAPSPTSPNPGPTTPGPTPTDSEPPDDRGCTITGTSGSEEIVGTPQDDIICALDGDDIVKGLGGHDVVYGDGGRDDIRGGSGGDIIDGGADKDTIRGSGGNDIILGRDDNDVITGGSGNDEALGGGGLDTIRGGGGKDELGGRGGSDNLVGGGGDDRLVGGPGADTLSGGRGTDRCSGNAGRDSFTGCERQRQ